MIKVDDLIRWAMIQAKGKTIKILNGFVSGKDLFDLAIKVKEKEPFDYIPVFAEDKAGNPDDKM